ncbi:MAG TPA: phosphoribosylanthranilate isomerase [Edaphobacter sp.]|nr:phosphoribosylanthranilate isomerase [Edaphobacter sp.]
MWVKICANTNLEDAQMAIELGADAVGFVFAPSVRRVTAKDVARITPHLPEHVERVGAFDSRYADEIAAIVRETGLSAVQLHGEWQPAMVARLNKLFDGQLKIIQTLHWQVNEDIGSAATVERLLREIESHGLMDRVLIDSRIGQATGGTGVKFDWTAASDVIRDGAGQLKVIVAGGLKPENVATAIQQLNPWGVDVASGVERGPGRKDPEKLAAFIRNARAAVPTH